MSKIIEVNPSKGICDYSLTCWRDGVEKMFCLCLGNSKKLHSINEYGDKELCNDANCPLPDSDAWKVELLGWIEDIINERYGLIDPRDVRQKIKEM